MANEVRKESIQNFLLQLAAKYEVLQKEKDYLQNEAAARITAINAERQELITEAQDQLDKLNALRAADNEQPFTLQEIRNRVMDKPERYTR